MAGASGRHKLRKLLAAPGRGAPGQHSRRERRGRVGMQRVRAAPPGSSPGSILTAKGGSTSPLRAHKPSLCSTYCVQEGCRKPLLHRALSPAGPVRPGTVPTRREARLVCVSVYSAPGSRGRRVGPAENKPGAVGKHEGAWGSQPRGCPLRPVSLDLSWSPKLDFPWLKFSP